MFSFEPRCQGECGSQKNTKILVHFVISWPWSQVSDFFSISGKHSISTDNTNTVGHDQVNTLIQGPKLVPCIVYNVDSETYLHRVRAAQLPISHNPRH
ncbi:hypothetical protein C5D35_02320 [Rathayibacter toxicus]|nr:hypothetical protein C5D35_02320 [Rathayibacter toxicus]